MSQLALRSRLATALVKIVVVLMAFFSPASSPAQTRFDCVVIAPARAAAVGAAAPASPANAHIAEAVAAYGRLLDGDPQPAYDFQATRLEQTLNWIVSRPTPGFRSRVWWRRSDENELAASRPGAVRRWRRRWERAAGDEAKTHKALMDGFALSLTELTRLDEAVFRRAALTPLDLTFRADESAAVIIRNFRALSPFLPNSIFLADAESYSIPELNELSPFPIYLIGYAAQVMQTDGNRYLPVRFTGHDVNHARESIVRGFRDALQNVIDGIWTPERYRRFVQARSEIWQAFREDAQSRSPAVRLAMHLAWHEMFHEFPFRDRDFENEMSARGILGMLAYPLLTGRSDQTLLEGIVARSAMNGSYGSLSETIGRADVHEAINHLRAFAQALPESLRAAECPRNRSVPVF